MKRPLVILTFFFCLGIGVSRFIRIPFVSAYVLAIVSLTLILLSRKRIILSDLFLLGLVFLLATSLIEIRQVFPKCHIRNIGYGYRNLYAVKGVIVSEPLFKINSTSFTFRVEEIGLGKIKRHGCGDILVNIKGRQNFRCQEELVLTGNLYRPFRDRKNRRQDYRAHLYNQGIFYILRVKNAYFAQRLNRNRKPVLKGLISWLKEKIEHMFSRHLSFISASIIGAMVLGDKRNIPQPIYNSMIKSGTVHILVVSGFNTGIVAFIIILFLRLIRLSRKLRICVSILLLVLYCLVTGASNPVVRATVMTVLFLSSYLFRRDPDVYNASCVAILFILGLNPSQLFDVGFQLSFASVISIIYLYPKIETFLGSDKLKAKYLKFLASSCLVSFSAWLGTMGFIVYYFRTFSPITVLANLFIVPLATLITLCGFSLVFMELIFPPFAKIFASSIEMLVAFLLQINALLIKVPGAYFYLS